MWPLVGDTAFQPAAIKSSVNVAKISQISSCLVVFTPDKSKWTRVPVLEQCETDVFQSETGAEKNHLRDKPSLDKNGRKNGDPGYSSCVTEFDGHVSCSITDYKIGGTYTIDGWVLGLAYVSTNRDIRGWTDPSKNISNGTALLSVSKSF